MDIEERRKVKPYSAYKPTGIPWLGEIPLNWEIWKIAHGFCLIGSGTTPPTNDLSWYEDGTIPWVTTSELRESIILNTEKKIIPEAKKRFPTLKTYPPSTLLIAMYGATIGRIGLLAIDATTNQACCALSSPVVFCPKYTYYWFQAFRNVIVNMAMGGGQPNLNQEIIKSLRIHTPPLAEQQAIADFLDRETAQIDTLIEKYTRLLDLLAEKRTALITHAVTRGLPPAPSSLDPKEQGERELKPSGIPWLGEIPIHWEVKTIKNVSGNRSDAVQTGPFGAQLHSSDYVDDGIPLILIKNVFALQIHDEDIPKITHNKAKSLSMYRLQKDDIVFSRVGSIGRIAPVSEKEIGWLISGQMLRLRLNNPDFCTKFLLYVFSCDEILKYIDLHSVGSTRDSINTEILRNLPFISPPLAEQQAIAAYLDQQTAKIDQTRQKIQTLIEKLKERRSALIIAAVTGKISITPYHN